MVTPLAAPTALAATVNGPNSVTLTWASTSANATGFTIQRATNTAFTGGGVATFNVSGATTLTYTDLSFTPNLRYYYRVEAINATSVSAWSNTASAASGLAVDVTATPNANAARTIVSPSFTTATPNELLLAFVSVDAGPTGANTTVTGITNTGGALTWTLVRRTNTQRGTAEVWRAFAPTVRTGTVTASFSANIGASLITVMSFSGVDTTGTGGSGAVGASASGSAATGAPTATLTTTRANSWVFGVGNDWDAPIARTLGPNQTLVSQFLATGIVETFWVQMMSAPTPTLGTLVTINDTAPTADRYNLTIVEVRTP